MKKIVLCKCLLMLAFINLSFAQLPNNGFENWSNMGVYLNPDGWGTMNNKTSHLGIFTATKGIPGRPGSSFLKLTSRTFSSSVVNGIAVSGILDSLTMEPLSGFAYNQRPQSFTGNWQHMIAAGSTQGSISVKLTKWDSINNSRELVASANQTLSGMAMVWTPFTINFVYESVSNPDTCIIVLKASGSTAKNTDYLWVDSLSFSGIVTNITNPENFAKHQVVYPNPSHKNISVDLDLKSASKTTFDLFDLTGKFVFSSIVYLPRGESRQTFDISGLAKGYYFIKISTENGIETRKISVE